MNAAFAWATSPSIFLACATVLYACACAHGVASAARGRTRGAAAFVFYALLGGGVLTQSVGLYLRGLESGALPLAGAFELLQAIGWCAVVLAGILRLFYRVPFLRRFVAGLAAALCAISWIFYDAAASAAGHDPWVSPHVALAVFAYACFALAAVCALMYLWQRRALSRKEAGGVPARLPPLSFFDAAMGALLPLGIAALGLSLALGFAYAARLPNAAPDVFKLCATTLVWLAFLGVWAARRLSKISTACAAWAAMACFAAALLSLWPVNRAHLRAQETQAEVSRK